MPKENKSQFPTMRNKIMLNYKLSEVTKQFYSPMIIMFLKSVTEVMRSDLLD